MKKLLALLTAPLTMTACIDLSNVDNASVGTDGGINDNPEALEGFAALRTAYDNTDLIETFKDVSANESLASVSAMSTTCDVDALKGTFNNVAEKTVAAAAIMGTWDGELNPSDNNGSVTAKYVENTPFYNDTYTSINTHTYTNNGYIDYDITDNKVDMEAHSYQEASFHVGIQSQFMIRVADRITQIWGEGTIEDVIKLTENVYAHRILNDQGKKEINVFNVDTGDTYTESTINGTNTGNSCYTGDDLERYIAEAKAINWYNSTEDFETVNVDTEFDRPSFNYSVDEIETKLGIN